jgi:pyruvate kinase
MRRAKIIATIGPASESEDRLRQLMLAGMDVARVNMSHGEREHHGEVIARIRRAAAALNRPIAILLDLSGPKIRTGKLRGGVAELKDGDDVCITSETIEGDAHRFSANYQFLSREVKPGGRILLSDGEIELQVISTTDTDVFARVVHGGTLGDHKGINLPGAKISIPSLTEKDIADLEYGISYGVDLVALSFVRGAADCRHARELIEQFGSDALLIAKIEKPEAVDAFSEILAEVDGAMVARGDLAVETSTELVPVYQKRVIAQTLLAGKIAITATQMLQSMIESPRPTRAEASDVANAVLDGSDAVMLSGESAVGRFPIEAVATMDRIIRAIEEMAASPEIARMKQSIYSASSGSVGRAIAEAASFAAEEVGSKLIVVVTQSGEMGRQIASLRPPQRIIALTPSEKTRSKLAVRWGVEPYLLDVTVPVIELERLSKEAKSAFGNSDVALAELLADMLASADRALVAYQVAEPGETVVVMAGKVRDLTLSHSIKIHTVGAYAPAPADSPQQP